MERNEQEAIRRSELGDKPTFSTGICGSLTCGYGKLDDNGYWEFPLYPVENYLNTNRAYNGESMKTNELKPPYISESLNKKWCDAVNYLRTKCAQPWVMDIRIHRIHRKNQIHNIKIGESLKRVTG